MSATTDRTMVVPAEKGHADCLMCGTHNPWSLGLEFRADETGEVHADFQAHPRLQGYEGVLHGGISASLLDAAMTHCLFHRNIRAVTGDLHIRFVQPIPCTSCIEIRAWIVQEKSPLYRLRAELRCAGHVMAWAEAKFMQQEAGEAEPNLQT